MEKFTELHVGSNKISVPYANYLRSVYGIDSSKANLITVPIEKGIVLDLKAKLSSFRDLLLVDAMVYRASVGDYSMVYDSLLKARKGLPKLENEHIASLFGARP